MDCDFSQPSLLERALQRGNLPFRLEEVRHFFAGLSKSLAAQEAESPRRLS